jgi:serine/threonine protein kinase
LSELVKAEGPLPEDQWWTVAAQLIDTLRYLDSLGIVHRDIKPSNIIMSESGISLIDFGISQDSDSTSITSTGLVSGSPAWLAPEQLEGTTLSSASDWFSAGSVLVFAAKGTSPWGNETSMTIPVLYQKILTASPDFSGLTDDQVDFVSGLLNSDPKLRKISKDLLKANAGSPIVLERVAQLQVPSKPARKTPKVAQNKITLKIKLIPIIVVGAVISVLVPSLLFVSETVSEATRGACQVIVMERDRLVEVFRESHAGGNSSLGDERAALEAAVNKYRNSISRISPNLQITQEFLSENDRLSQDLLTTLYNLDDSLPTAYAFGLEYKKLTSHIVSVTGTGKVCSEG